MTAALPSIGITEANLASDIPLISHEESGEGSKRRKKIIYLPLKKRRPMPLSAPHRAN